MRRWSASQRHNPQIAPNSAAASSISVIAERESTAASMEVAKIKPAHAPDDGASGKKSGAIRTSMTTTASAAIADGNRAANSLVPNTDIDAAISQYVSGGLSNQRAPA
jgi:hypothetical protein